MTTDEYRVMVTYTHVPSGRTLSGYRNQTNESSRWRAEQIADHVGSESANPECTFIKLWTRNNEPLFATGLVWDEMSEQSIIIPQSVLRDCICTTQVATVSGS
jgi:hypothetical protein